jgi:hypothetical protein
MFHTDDPQILGTIVQYLVAMATMTFYTAVAACPAYTHILQYECVRWTLLFSRTQYGT